MDGTRMGKLASSVGIANLAATEALQIFRFAELVAAEAAEEEREECAKIADEHDADYANPAGRSKT
jgi:hypothetical protein